MISEPNQARWVAFVIACVALVLFWNSQRPSPPAVATAPVLSPSPTTVEIELASPARLSLDGVAQSGRRVSLPLDGKRHSLRIFAKRAPMLLDP